MHPYNGIKWSCNVCIYEHAHTHMTYLLLPGHTRQAILSEIAQSMTGELANSPRVDIPLGFGRQLLALFLHDLPELVHLRSTKGQRHLTYRLMDPEKNIA